MKALDAGDNEDLAVNLAHSEIKRRATVRKASRQARISEEEEQERRAAGICGNWEEACTNDDQEVSRDTLSQQMQNLRLQVNGEISDQMQKGDSRPKLEDRQLIYHYPAIPEQREYKSDFSTLYALKDESFEAEHENVQVPEPPPKKREIGVSSYIGFSQTFHDGVSNPEVPVIVPQSQQELRPATFTFKPSAYLENGSPLRTIFLPPDLRLHFLQIALPNTQANLETCGILCGTLISNALFISKLVIPDQESTSDTCETVNEDKLFDFVDGEDLMVLGWIHTHPTQTCFMSSRDLHTHSGYQAMMPESIAIVCAPSKGEYG